MRILPIFFSCIAAPATAFAQDAEVAASGSLALSTETEAQAAPADPGKLVVGLEVGAIFPQPFSELGTHVAFGVEVGWKLPPWGRRLEVFLAAGFSPPGHDFTDDPYRGELLLDELHFSLGPRFRFRPTSSKWNASLAAGPRLFLLRSFSDGSRGDAKFAEFREQSTEIGLFAAVGGEYRLGPGAILLDVDLGWAKLDHRITGDTSTGNVAATLGYRFFFL